MRGQRVSHQSPERLAKVGRARKPRRGIPLQRTDQHRGEVGSSVRRRSSRRLVVHQPGADQLVVPLMEQRLAGGKFVQQGAKSEDVSGGPDGDIATTADNIYSYGEEGQ